MKFVARAVLAVSLLLGVYVLAAGVLALLGLAVYEGVVHGVAGALLSKVGGLLIFVGLALGRAFWLFRKARGKEPSGLLITPDEQPGLWAEVHSIAETVGTRAPDAIRLVPEVNASVWENARFLGLVSGRRVLTVGAPLVLGLSRQQMRSVLAHELGHYSHRHTAMTPVVYRGHVTLAHLVQSLGATTLLGRLFSAYGRLYLRVTRSITRRQEIEADEWSHRVAGRAASAGAMREVPAIDMMWSHFLESHAFRVAGVRPDALFAGFESLLASPERQRQMQELRSTPPEEELSIYDSHPSLRSRIAYFESQPEDGISDDGVPATELLAGADRVLGALETEMFAGSDLEPRPWSWIVETGGIQRARHNASLLVSATADAGAGAATLYDAVRVLVRDDGRRLIRPFISPDTPSDHVEAVARGLVTDAVTAALVEHCGAHFKVDWDTEGALVDGAGEPIDVRGLVAAAVEGRSADWLMQILESEGVPSSYSVDPSTVDRSAAHADVPVVHSVAACVSWRRLRVLVVGDHGILVKRLGLGEGFAAALRHGRTDPYLTAVHHVASIPMPRLLEDRRATLVPWDRVGSARISGRRLALALDGRNHRMKVQPQAVAGDLVGSLQLHLGERLAVA